MHSLSCTLVPAAVALALMGCGALFGVGDLPPLADSNGDGGTSGAANGLGPDGAPLPGADGSSVHRADSGAFGSDPRWPLWPIGPDVPPPSNFAFENGPDGAMITDATTGLVWQDTVSTQTRTFDDAQTYCDGLVYDSKDDWRAPTRMEMVSVLKFAKGAFAPRPDSFSGPPIAATCHWTSSTGSDGKVWYIQGGVELADKLMPCYVRCVRGGPPLGTHAKHPYTIDTGTVLDPATGLLWERTPLLDQFLTEPEGDARCKALTLNGRSARLPTVKELLSIVDETAFTPAADPVFGPLDDDVWSSSPSAQTTGWTVDFRNGNTNPAELGSHHVTRCVAAP